MDERRISVYQVVIEGLLVSSGRRSSEEGRGSGSFEHSNTSNAVAPFSKSMFDCTIVRA